MGYSTSRETPWKTDVNYSTADKLLFDIRRYARAIVALHVIFVAVIVVTFGMVWNQISKYDIIKPENINTINSYVIATIGNAKDMTALAVPLVSNLQYASSGLAGAVSALYNISNGNSGGRHLLDDAVTQQMLADEDYRLRVMVYTQVHALLAASNNQVQAFDMGAVNLIMEATGQQIAAINFTGLAQRYDRTMDDLEHASHFGVLATAMLGAVSQVTNVTYPGLADVQSVLTSKSSARR
jgi:hypothetical protein